MSTKKNKARTKARRTAKRNGTGPVAQVWKIATAMPKAERKDILAACEKAGINSATAATQYTHWRRATPAERQKKLARWAGEEPKTK